MARKKGILRKLLWGALIALGVVLVVCTALFIHLDRQVTKQFEGRRWTLPAQVYAAPLELYAGLQLSGPQLEDELERLQYREVPKLERPGTYRRQPSGSSTRYEVALRPARFADEIARSADSRNHDFSGRRHWTCGQQRRRKCPSPVSSRCSSAASFRLMAKTASSCSRRMFRRCCPQH